MPIKLKNNFIVEIKNYLKEKMDNQLYLHSIGTYDYSLTLLNIHLDYYLNNLCSNNRNNIRINKLNKKKKIYNQVSIASLLHDYGKIYTYEEMIKIANENNILLSSFEKENRQIIHGLIAPYLISKDLNIKDKQIYKAIRSHTIGSNKMGFIDKIIYIADKLEVNRNFEGIENLRKLSYKNLDLCLLEVYKSNIIYVISKNYLLHPNTSKIWNNICGGLKNATK